MIPQEKAKELVNKYLQVYDGRLPIAKQCALIAVDEIINSRPCIPSPIPCDNITDYFIQAKKYWEEVKTEIENL